MVDIILFIWFFFFLGLMLEQSFCLWVLLALLIFICCSLYFLFFICFLSFIFCASNKFDLIWFERHTSPCSLRRHINRRPFAVWVVESSLPKEPCIRLRWGPRSPCEGAILNGKEVDNCNVRDVTCFSRKDVSFGVCRWQCCQFRWSNPPKKFRGVNRRF